MQLKANKVRHLTDARYFSARGVSIIGFDLNPNSPDFVSPDKLHAIREWVDGVRFAGEFGLSRPDHIIEQTNILGLDFIQLPFFFDLSQLPELAGFKIIHQLVVEETSTTESLADFITDRSAFVTAVELDFLPCGLNPLAGESIGINGLNALTSLHSVFLRAPHSADSIARIKDLSELAGLSFSGSDEEKTGFKSFEEIDEIIDYLEDEQLFDPYG